MSIPLFRADNNFKIGKNYWQFDPKFTTAPNNVDSMLAWAKGFGGTSTTYQCTDLACYATYNL